MMTPTNFTTFIDSLRKKTDMIKTRSGCVKVNMAPIPELSSTSPEFETMTLIPLTKPLINESRIRNHDIDPAHEAVDKQMKQRVRIPWHLLTFHDQERYKYNSHDQGLLKGKDERRGISQCDFNNRPTRAPE
jgi:hypothetical protein